VAAKATDETAKIDVDTVIFAIGDVHDATLGMPTGATGYVTRDSADPKQTAYEVFDPQKGQILDGIYVVGWARRASDGLVGIARHDAERGAEHILEYLKRVPETDSLSPRQVHQYLEDKGVRVVNNSDLGDLGKVEESEAKRRGLTHFKFNDDASMLAAIEREKARAGRQKVFIGSNALPIPCLRPSIQLQCALPSEAAVISTFVDNLIHLLTQSRCIPATEDNIEMALREALNNAVVHGNRGDPQRRVCVQCRCESGQVSIAISDEGEGFDVGKVPDPTQPGNIYSTRGRGIYLMKAFMDEVRFEHGGSVVRMRKRVLQAEP
jgi:serine/threonine-protein kinase RsbW